MTTDPTCDLDDAQLLYLTKFAARWGCVLVLNGEVGFGRPCVGISSDSAYVDYQHIWDLRPQPEFWSPVDAYHKHDCLAVLGHGPDSVSQLYDWVRWLDEHGWTVETVDRHPRDGLDALFHGLSTTRLVPPTPGGETT